MVLPILLLAAAACSGADSTLSSSDVTDLTASAYRTSAATTVKIDPATAKVAVGSNVKLSTNFYDSQGRRLTGMNATFARWVSSDTTVATVQSSGVVHGIRSGTVTVKAFAGTATGEGHVTVGDGAAAPTTPTPPATTTPAPPTTTTPLAPPSTGGTSSEPLPRTGDRMLLDGRSSIQQGTSFTSAWPTAKLGVAPLGSTAMYEIMNGIPFNFTTDMDGVGTHALRLDWPAWNGTCQDAAATLVTYLPTPYAKHVIFSWKHRMGRTATGGGVGALNSFQITNTACGNASRKMFLVLRDLPDMGGTDRIDLIWPGPAPVNPAVTASAGSTDVRYDATRGVFNPQQHIGETITTTYELKAESAVGARDGIVRLWINGVKLIDVTNAPIGAEAIERFQFPATFNSPAQAQSEYFWDIVAWSPQGG